MSSDVGQILGVMQGKYTTVTAKVLSSSSYGIFISRLSIEETNIFFYIFKGN